MTQDLIPTAGAVCRKARLAVHRPSACSGVKALRNTSCATADTPPSSA